jgi:hypothetical protein
MKLEKKPPEKAADTHILAKQAKRILGYLRHIAGSINTQAMCVFSFLALDSHN